MAKDKTLATTPAAPKIRRRRIVRHHFLVFATLVGGALIASIIVEMGLRFQETRRSLGIEHRQMAELAALRIHNYIDGVAQSVRLAAQPRRVENGQITDDYVIDLRNLLKNVAAIRDVVAIGLDGRENLRVSRIGRSVVDPAADHSSTPYFTTAHSGQIYFGPIVFPSDSFEPRILIAAPIEPFRGEVIGVLAAQVNVRYVWDVVQAIHVGQSGYAYVVSGNGTLVAHPDLHLVLQHKDLSDFPQVAALRNADDETDTTGIYSNLKGEQVLVSHVRIPSVGWTVMVERPLAEAYAPLLASLTRTGGILLLLCLMTVGAAVLLGRRIVRPIEALRRGAGRLEAGDMDARIEVKTGDEFEDLAEDFNRMSARLRDSYATLEGKVEERTRQLAIANQAKSRFLAAASHDLRQPLHALGLFIAQLHTRMSAEKRRWLIGRIEASLAAMNELFNALLDISKLDAGVLTPNVTEFPVAQLLARIESTFAGAAHEKGLSFGVVSTAAWVRSDFILLERILFNLVSNAVRYTDHGGVLVGCRKRDGRVRIEVWDTGLGIPQNQHGKVFGEFYRLGEPARERQAGLGLGLAIVDRLCRLLDLPIDLASQVGRGTRFSVAVPLVAARPKAVELSSLGRAPVEISRGKLVVVIDDDPLVLDGMGGIFRSWGCGVVAARSYSEALRGLAEHEGRPDLIVSDFCLPQGETGIATIEKLRAEFRAPIPAFLISGDTNPELLREARASGFHLLHKPVAPMALRALVNQILIGDSPDVGARFRHVEVAE